MYGRIVAGIILLACASHASAQSAVSIASAALANFVGSQMDAHWVINVLGPSPFDHTESTCDYGPGNLLKVHVGPFGVGVLYSDQDARSRLTSYCPTACFEAGCSTAMPAGMFHSGTLVTTGQSDCSPALTVGLEAYGARLDEVCGGIQEQQAYENCVSNDGPFTYAESYCSCSS